MLKDCKTVWNNCLRIIRENIAEQSFKTWFEPIVPVRLINNVLTIQVPSQFFYEWLEEHYVHVLRKAIDAELGTDGRLEYSIIVDKGNDKNKPYVINIPTSSKSANGSHGNGKDTKVSVHAEKYKSPFEYDSLENAHLASYLNPQYTFENFIEGDCNRLARSAGYAVANKPGVTSFNPLMLYGGVGLGKTHLVQAIGNHIKNTASNKFVLYVSSEKFTNQFIDALKNNNMQNFTNFYLQVDVLVIDDVQFLAGKERTQEIFFHIFNHLHQAGKQIIMTSDCPPRELKGLQDRLLSRFKWGLTADLQQPDLETRIAIIQKKLQAEGIFIPPNVIEYLAHSVDTNIRELEGVIVSLMAQASLNRKEIDLDLARQTLQNIVQHVDKEVSIEIIQKKVVEHFGLTLEELRGKSRRKEYVIPRQIAIYLAKEHTEHSLKSIGYHFGGRDHSTVIHAIQSVNDMLKTDQEVKAAIQSVQKQLKLKMVK
ncbi:chromosomal replication initiator protein DnaA [Rhodocytophaga rosea]|uniref:Chromosomal replication initiator protein DnaA n=1 Tax=Rhodocytophaga rosea TaxID=2704465 RepID=A0A6C0GDH7_9BACT|nr:chromosomal replication initiator protein DnaA [Rhodocytophaga rosea]QHT65853.1 chromosomal replication initiator protein DnaA [Rhodocytophaga rosea]